MEMQEPLGLQAARQLDLSEFSERWGDRVLENENGCLLWQDSTNDGGYGTVTFGGKSWYAHRLSWVLFVGSIPAGLWVLHKCDTPPCVNPEHLFLGDAGVNTRDCWEKGRGVMIGWLERSDGTQICKLPECGRVVPVDRVAWCSLKCMANGGARIFRTGRAEKSMKTMESHCHKGHEFTVENTRIAIRKDGRVRQVCRTCDRERKRNG